MNIEEIFEKIKNRELTICETCDNIFDYVRWKVFCDECNTAKKRKKNKRNLEAYHKRMQDPEWVEEKRVRARKYREENPEKIKASQRKYREKRVKDPEWVKRYNAKSRARYLAKKKQED